MMKENDFKQVVDLLKKRGDVNLGFVSFLRAKKSAFILDTLKEGVNTIFEASQDTWRKELSPDSSRARRVTKFFATTIPSEDPWECLRQLFDFADEYSRTLSLCFDDKKPFEAYLKVNIQDWKAEVFSLNTHTLFNFLVDWGVCLRKLEREDVAISVPQKEVLTEEQIKNIKEAMQKPSRQIQKCTAACMKILGYLDGKGLRYLQFKELFASDFAEVNMIEKGNYSRVLADCILKYEEIKRSKGNKVQ